MLIALVLVISVPRPFDGLPRCDRTTSSKVGPLLEFAPIRSLVAGGISRFFWLLQWGARFFSVRPELRALFHFLAGAVLVKT